MGKQRIGGFYMGQERATSGRPLWLSKEIHWDLIRLTVPTIISTLAIPLLGIVDTAVLGRLPDVRQLAGATSAGVILSVVFQMFFFLRMATTALVAQRWGADDRRGATLISFQALVLSVILGIGLIVLRHPISLIGFALVGAPEDVTALSNAYFTVRVLEAPFYFMTLALTGMMRGQGDAVMPMYIVIGINVVNIAGDLLLVPGTFGLPSFGVVGAAWASLVAQAAGCAAAIVVGWRRLRPYWDWTWFHSLRRLPWQRFFSISSHLFIRTLALVLTLAAVTALVARLESATILAAHAILMQLWSLVSHGVDGFAYATEAMVGLYLGRGDKSRAHASGVAAMLWGVGLGTLFALTYFAAVDRVAFFFTHNREVAEIVISLVWAIALSQPVNAAAYVFDGILIGATDTRYLRNAMLVSAAVFAATIGIGWLASGLSLPLVWWALLLFMATRALTLGVRFRSGRWYDAASNVEG